MKIILSNVAVAANLDVQERKLVKLEERIAKLSVQLKEAKVQRTETKKMITQLKRGKPPVVRPAYVGTKPPRPVEAKPGTKPKPSDSSINVKDYKAFDRKVMKGPVWFDTLNGKSKARVNIEGYWRRDFNKGLSTLPFPVAMTVKGYDKAKFMEALTVAEKKASNKPQRGTSPNRWTGGSNGSGEYHLNKWKWPQGIRYYLNQGVPPSRAFYEFITGKDLPGLPTYGRN